jgi:hypothetical protein
MWKSAYVGVYQLLLSQFVFFHVVSWQSLYVHPLVISWKTDTKFLYFYSRLPSVSCYTLDSWLAVCWGAVWNWQQPHCHACRDHFVHINKNSKCSLGLGCIYSYSHGNYLHSLQLITLFMWPWTLTNLSESQVLEVNRNQLSTVQNKTCRIE